MADRAIPILLAHLAGDYIFQTDHMAQEKTEYWGPAVLHGISYGACHLPLTRKLVVLLVISGTHILIDRYRLVKYPMWAKNQLAPKRFRYPISEAGTFGYRADSPAFLQFVLGVVADNTTHLAINWAALRWLT